mmetsp:Transcript_13215/g.38396  ORF Transcript_13215/g.38396 Transcript_13215/m.38396 type:complete len:120 (-) Transcript_13215:369-728(-)
MAATNSCGGYTRTHRFTKNPIMIGFLLTDFDGKKMRLYTSGKDRKAALDAPVPWSAAILIFDLPLSSHLKESQGCLKVPSTTRKVQSSVPAFRGALVKQSSTGCQKPNDLHLVVLSSPV